MRCLGCTIGCIGLDAQDASCTCASGIVLPDRPVNYAFDERTQSVVFRSALGSKLREGLSSGTAAFEIDGTDPVERAGWSVIIVGEAEEVTDSPLPSRFVRDMIGSPTQNR